MFIPTEGQLLAKERDDEQVAVPKVMLAMIVRLDGNVLWAEDFLSLRVECFYSATLLEGWRTDC